MRFCSVPIPLESNGQGSESPPGTRIRICRIHATWKTSARFRGHHSKRNRPSLGTGSESFRQSGCIKMNAVVSNLFSLNAVPCRSPLSFCDFGLVHAASRRLVGSFRKFHRQAPGGLIFLTKPFSARSHQATRHLFHPGSVARRCRERIAGTTNHQHQKSP